MNDKRPPPDAEKLPAPDPEAMKDAAARFLRKPKPSGGWKPGREIRQTEKKEGDGA